MSGGIYGPEFSMATEFRGFHLFVGVFLIVYLII